MDYLFHQNMRAFGGRATASIAKFGSAFNDIALGLGANNIAVAGFTEVLNVGSAVAAMKGASGLCKKLGTDYYATVYCGRTALNRAEYITISVRTGLTVLKLGRLIYISGKPVYYDSPDVTDTPWRKQFPKGIGVADYRCVVFVIVNVAANSATRVAVGFIHNMYTLEDQKLVAMQSLGAMAKCLKDKVAVNYIYFGGDFNTVPRDRGNKRTVSLTAYSNFNLPNRPDGCKPGGSTWHGSKYDYWFSNIPRNTTPPPNTGLISPIPGGNAKTMNNGPAKSGGMSDHAAIFLRIS